jgi:hypothetical protein
MCFEDHQAVAMEVANEAQGWPSARQSLEWRSQILFLEQRRVELGADLL